MPKSTIKLPDGTIITIDGNPEEIRHILSIYSTEQTKFFSKQKPSSPSKKKGSQKAVPNEDGVDLIMAILTSIKECDEASEIESNILDRISQIDRTLLPLYISKKYHDNKFSLTSGNISKILSDLGVPINITNISRILSGSARKYVVGDKVRKQGQPVKYLLTRRGVQYISGVINDDN